MIKGCFTVKCEGKDCEKVETANIPYVPASMDDVINAVNKVSETQFVVMVELGDEGAGGFFGNLRRVYCSSCYSKIVRDQKLDGVGKVW